MLLLLHMPRMLRDSQSANARHLCHGIQKEIPGADTMGHLVICKLYKDICNGHEKEKKEGHLCWGGGGGGGVVIWGHVILHKHRQLGLQY